LVIHLFERGWIAFPKQVENAVASLKRVRPSVTPTFMMILYVTIVGPSGLLRNGRQLAAFAESWFESVARLPMSSAIGYVILAFKALVEREMANKSRTAIENLTYFTHHWAERPILHGGLVTGLFSLPLILISPGFWVYLTTLWKGRRPSFSFSLNLAGLLNPDLAGREDAIKFDLLGITSLCSIDWSDRETIQAQLGLSVNLCNEIEKLIDADLRASSERALVVLIDPIEPVAEEFHGWYDGFDPDERIPFGDELLHDALSRSLLGVPSLAKQPSAPGPNKPLG
jgi:hypothetical protein